jgi:coenzyme Q-binding protein COQ10
MPSLTQSKILPYSAKQIHDLVMDIEKYPEFLPWCKNARITEVISENNLHADLLINFKSFFEKYTSNVEHKKTEDGFEINVIAIKGPFKSLVNRWNIDEISTEKCRVDFFIEFEFNSIFLTKMIGVIFEKATNKMMEAFENRAREIYRS